MSLPTFKKKDEIPKGFEALYEEVDGEWSPKDEDSPLKTKLAEERDKREAAEALTKKTAKELKKLQDMAGNGDEIQKKIDAAVELAVAETRKEFEPVVAEAAKIKAENRDLKLKNVVKEQFAKAGILAERIDDTWKLHGDEFDLTEDGKPVVKGAPKTELSKHVATIVKARPDWVAGTKAGGGGAAGTSAGTGGATAAEEVGKVDPTQRLRAAHEAGATA